MAESIDNLRATLAKVLRELAADAQSLGPRERAFWQAVHRGTGAIINGRGPDSVQRGMLQVAAALERQGGGEK